jgi:hypothetical protein
MKYYTTVLAPIVLAGYGAFGATIFDNGGPDRNNGGEASWWLQADNFTLGGGGATLTGATFWTADRIPGIAGVGPEVGWHGDLQWWILADNGGTPGTVVASDMVTGGVGVNRVATGASSGIFQTGLYAEYENTLSFGGAQALGAGTYWLALHLSGDGDFTTFRNIFWETTAQHGDSMEKLGGLSGVDVNGDPTPWVGTGGIGFELAFNLQGPDTSVPEPASTGALLGAAFLGLCSFARRLKR